VSGPPAVLGLDLGTSQAKALLCAADGTGTTARAAVPGPAG
jgi:sugar (pentulose or hexulose) kinase